MYSICHFCNWAQKLQLFVLFGQKFNGARYFFGTRLKISAYRLTEFFL